MNGLLVNSYTTSNYTPKSVHEEEEASPPLPTHHYYTWPRKSKSFEKRKVSHILDQLKKDHTISEINLNLKYVQVDHIAFEKGDDDFSKLINQKRINSLREYDRRLKESNQGRDNAQETSDNAESSKKGNDNGVEKNSGSDESIFDENKLGILRILKK